MDQLSPNVTKSDAKPAPTGSSATRRAQPIVVRRPTKSDVTEFARHFSEMQAHYKRPVSDAVAIKAASLACKPAASTFDPRVLIALRGDAIVGSVVMNVTFPASELTLSLYIRDLFRSRELARHNSVGTYACDRRHAAQSQRELLCPGMDH